MTLDDIIYHGGLTPFSGHFLSSGGDGYRFRGHFPGLVPVPVDKVRAFVSADWVMLNSLKVKIITIFYGFYN